MSVVALEAEWGEVSVVALEAEWGDWMEIAKDSGGSDPQHILRGDNTERNQTHGEADSVRFLVSDRLLRSSLPHTLRGDSRLRMAPPH